MKLLIKVSFNSCLFEPDEALKQKMIKFINEKAAEITGLPKSEIGLQESLIGIQMNVATISVEILYPIDCGIVFNSKWPIPLDIRLQEELMKFDEWPCTFDVDIYGLTLKGQFKHVTVESKRHLGERITFLD
jgi:hypothetical protein